MPATKHDSRHMAFARLMAMGRSNHEAAKEAGYQGNKRTLSATASRLLNRDNVKEEIARVKAEAHSNAALSVERVVREVFEVLEESRAEGDRRAALQALKLLGDHLGMWVTKVRHTTVDDEGEETGLRVITLPVADFSSAQDGGEE